MRIKKGAVMLIDSVQLTEIKLKLEKVIDPELDSVRFYYLGNKWEKK